MPTKSDRAAAADTLHQALVNLIAEAESAIFEVLLQLRVTHKGKSTRTAHNFITSFTAVCINV